MAKITTREMSVEQAQQARDEAAQAVQKARVDLEMAEDDLAAAHRATGEPQAVPATLVDAMERFFTSLAGVDSFEEVGDGIYGFLYAAPGGQMPISLTISVTQ